MTSSRSTPTRALRDDPFPRSARSHAAIRFASRRGFERTDYGLRTGWDGAAVASRSSLVSRKYRLGRFARVPLAARLEPDAAIRFASRRGFERTDYGLRTGWDSNPRGREPTRFPIVRLKPLGHPSNAAVDRPGTRPPSLHQHREWDGAAVAPRSSLVSRKNHVERSAHHPFAARPEPTPAIRFASRAWVRTLVTPTNTRDRIAGAHHIRREWDSNPRGPETNALAGRRLKPLGHPSKAETPRQEKRLRVAPLGLEPRLS